MRRRKLKTHWLFGVGDTAVVLNAAATYRHINLVVAQDIKDYGFAGQLYVRRIVGTVQHWPQAEATAGIFYAGIYPADYAGGAAQNIAPEGALDYEDHRWLWRKDFALEAGHAASTPDLSPFFGYVDWRGMCKVTEGTKAINLSFTATAAYWTFARLRVLVQTPRS